MAKAEGKDDSRFLLNTKDTAEVFGVTFSALEKWKLPKSLKRKGDDKREVFYDLREIFKFRLDMLTPKKKLDLIDEQARLAASRREKIDLEIGVRKGELIEKVLVEKSAFSTGRIIRDGIMNIPDRVSGVLAAETSQEKVHQILTKENREALEALTNAPYS